VFYYVSTLEFSLKDRTLPFDERKLFYRRKEKKWKEVSFSIHPLRVNTLERWTHQGKKNGRLTFATRERGSKREGGGGLKTLSFSKRVPRRIRARSAWTYFAIFSRHAISGMTNGGCAPFYPSSIIPSSFVLLDSCPLFFCSFCYSLSLFPPLPSPWISSIPLFCGSSSRMPRLCPRKSIIL